jgi:hypothetical protein
MVGVKTSRAAQPTVTEAVPTVPPPPFRDPYDPRKFGPSEVPDILKDVVDFLFPLVTPYDAAFYLYMLRLSIVEDGQPYLRLSTRGVTHGVVRSARARDDAKAGICQTRVRGALSALQKAGAIRKEGGPNRKGTLYKVLAPEEIATCRAAKRAREAAAAKPSAPPVDVEAEVDFYNVRENRVRIFERDGYACRYCARRLTRHTATLDHVVPVSAGGGHGWDNLVTACLECNSAKTGRAVGDFLAERRSVAP